MLTLNMGSVLSKVDAWKKSPTGKKRMAAVVGKYIRDGRSVTDAGSPIVSVAEMSAAANAMIQLLVSTAASYSLAPSVMAVISSASHTAPQKSGEGYSVSISLGGDKSRPSLYPVKYGGVDNIVALMNNGYSTSHDVWGEWHGNFIYGRRSRPALGFMQ